MTKEIKPNKTLIVQYQSGTKINRTKSVHFAYICYMGSVEWISLFSLPYDYFFTIAKVDRIKQTRVSRSDDGALL